MKHRGAALLGLVLVSVALAGCFGQAKEDLRPTKALRPREITQEAERQFEELTQLIPPNYTFPGQEALEPVVVWLNGTIDSTANAAIESPNDDGGFNYKTYVIAEDVSRYIPPNQAAEVHIKLWWHGNPGQSADLDIFTDLPGIKSHHDPGTDQHFNWNIPVKREVVNTVGVAGRPHLIGVQVTNGRIAPGQQMPFFLEMRFDYAKDVLTAHHPYAFTLPEGATGVVMRSVKVFGDEHVKATFIVLDPQDNLVTFQEYNDIAIPTESVFIPLRQPGEHVFYAYEMTGGFLSLKADSPVPQREARILSLQEERAIDFQQPLAPGVVGRSVGAAGQSVETPYQPGAKAATFTVERTWPLRVEGFFEEGQSVAGDAEVRILGPSGDAVFRAVRSARVDGSDGSMGWSGDNPPFVTRDFSKLGKGAYTVEVVVNGYTGKIGHSILTYDRGSAAGGA